MNINQKGHESIHPALTDDDNKLSSFVNNVVVEDKVSSNGALSD